MYFAQLFMLVDKLMRKITDKEESAANVNEIISNQLAIHAQTRKIPK